jgi:hypothetical protein
MGWGPDMAQAQTYYDYDFHKRLTWSFAREQIGRYLRKRYQVPEELPPNLHALVRKLLEAVEGNQFRYSEMITDYARSSGVKAFPEWFVRT